MSREPWRTPKTTIVFPPRNEFPQFVRRKLADLLLYHLRLMIGTNSGEHTRPRVCNEAPSPRCRGGWRGRQPAHARRVRSPATTGCHAKLVLEFFHAHAGNLLSCFGFRTNKFVLMPIWMQKAQVHAPRTVESGISSTSTMLHGPSHGQELCRASDKTNRILERDRIAIPHHFFQPRFNLCFFHIKLAGEYRRGLRI